MALKVMNDWPPTLYSYIWEYRTMMTDWKMKDKWKQILIHTLTEKQDLGKSLKRQTNGWIIKLGARINQSTDEGTHYEVSENVVKFRY